MYCICVSLWSHCWSYGFSMAVRSDPSNQEPRPLSRSLSPCLNSLRYCFRSYFFFLLLVASFFRRFFISFIQLHFFSLYYLVILFSRYWVISLLLFSLTPCTPCREQSCHNIIFAHWKFWFCLHGLYRFRTVPLSLMMHEREEIWYLGHALTVLSWWVTPKFSWK